MGRRLGEFTANNTKCMIEVNGRRLIDRMLRQLHALPLSRIVIVIGYEGGSLRAHIEKNFPEHNIVFVENPVYDKTTIFIPYGSLASIWPAKTLCCSNPT